MQEFDQTKLQRENNNVSTSWTSFVELIYLSWPSSVFRVAVWTDPNPFKAQSGSGESTYTHLRHRPKAKFQGDWNTKNHWEIYQVNTVCEAEVGGMNNVRPPSMHSLFRKTVTGLGARYLHKSVISAQRHLPNWKSKNIQEDVKLKYPPWNKGRSENCIDGRNFSRTSLSTAWGFKWENIKIQTSRWVANLPFHNDPRPRG